MKRSTPSSPILAPRCRAWPRWPHLFVTRQFVGAFAGMQTEFVPQAEERTPRHPEPRRHRGGAGRPAAATSLCSSRPDAQPSSPHHTRPSHRRRAARRACPPGDPLDAPRSRRNRLSPNSPVCPAPRWRRLAMRRRPRTAIRHMPVSNVRTSSSLPPSGLRIEQRAVDRPHRPRPTGWLRPRSARSGPRSCRRRTDPGEAARPGGPRSLRPSRIVEHHQIDVGKRGGHRAAASSPHERTSCDTLPDSRVSVAGCSSMAACQTSRTIAS